MDYIKALEKEITDHFEGKVREFQDRNSYMTFNEALSTWADRYSAIYNTPSYVNEFVESSLKPKFGITYSDLQESLRSEGTTFMRYVESLLESRLREGGIFGNKEDDSEKNQEEAKELKAKVIAGSIGVDEDTLDNLDDDVLDNLLGSVELQDDDVEGESDSDDPEESAKEKKAAIIKKMSGDENLDLSDEDDEELDSLMGKLSSGMKVDEKVIVIRNAFKEKDNSIIEKAIAKGTGMTLEESKMVLEMLDE